METAAQADHAPFTDSGISLDVLQFPGTENIIPPRPHHLIGIHTGQPMTLLQQRDGQRHERLFLPGDTVVIPAGLENYCAHRSAAEGIYISLNPDLIQNVALAADLQPKGFKVINHFGANDPFLHQIGVNLAEEARSPGLGGQLYVQALTQQITIHLLRRYSSQGVTIRHPSFSERSARQRVQAALDIIQDQLDSDLSLDALAAATHLTAFHFSRVFKEATGQSPHQYVIQQRVERAKHLLLHSRLSIAEIAAHVGFADQSHLNRHFKRLTGYSPRDHIKTARMS